ncbi:hypothetical protein DSUL_50321 [Desulfovibrionales bacterium]
MRLIFPDGSDCSCHGRINFTDTQASESTGVAKTRTVFSNPNLKFYLASSQSTLGRRLLC